MYKRLIALAFLTVAQPLLLHADIDPVPAAGFGIAGLLIGAGISYFSMSKTKAQESIEPISKVESRHAQLRKKFHDALEIMSHPSKNQQEKEKALINHVYSNLEYYNTLHDDLTKFRQEQIHSNNQIEVWRARNFASQIIHEKQHVMVVIEQDCKEFEKLEQTFHRVKPYVVAVKAMRDTKQGLQGLYGELVDVINAHGQMQHASARKQQEIWQDMHNAISRHGESELFLIHFVEQLSYHIKSFEQTLRELKSSSAALIDPQFVKQADELLEKLKTSHSFIKKSQEYLMQMDLHNEWKNRDREAQSAMERDTRLVAEAKAKRDEKKRLADEQEKTRIAIEALALAKAQDVARAAYEAETDRINKARDAQKELEYIRSGAPKKELDRYKNAYEALERKNIMLSNEINTLKEQLNSLVQMISESKKALDAFKKIYDVYIRSYSPEAEGMPEIRSWETHIDAAIKKLS